MNFHSPVMDGFFDKVIPNRKVPCHNKCEGQLIVSPMGHAMSGANLLEPFAELIPGAMQKVLHNLHVHQVELSAQNTELRRIQIELDVERARYFNLYNLAPVTSIRFSHFIYSEDQDAFYKLRRKIVDLALRDDLDSELPKATEGCELRMVKSDGAIFWAQL